MVQDKSRLQVVWLRFTDITLPRGATVTSAYVQFQVDEVSTGPADLTVRGQAADDPVVHLVERGHLRPRDDGGGRGLDPARLDIGRVTGAGPADP